MTRDPLIRLFHDAAIADNFAGGGGASEGIRMALGRDPDVAINHDREALAMHKVNHPHTRHYPEDVFDVDPVDACDGRGCALAWFSPDCTYHSKARGAKPFRDRNRARRVRGLAWVMVKWAKCVRPTVMFMENVEEFKDWCPLRADGTPDPKKRGASFRRFLAALRNVGYAVEHRELRASEFGAPTSRKRLFLIARCDGRPIVWPSVTHGKRTALKPFHTAAECIDFSIPIPSIFLTPKEAREWAREHGCDAPRRPLAAATLRRIARGVTRFVLNSPKPFIVEDYAPTLIQTSYGERKGQAPRTLDLFAPLGTIVAGGIKHSLVAAFLAKHNGGHEATGQRVTDPIHTIVCRENKALVTSHMLKLRGGLSDHVNTSQDLREPVPTLTAGGTHIAEVRAFLMKWYGTKQDGCVLDAPIDTLTTKARFGLVTVLIDGETYVIYDIGMRMLTPRELYRAQGFREDYEIEHGVDIETGLKMRLTKKAQTRLVGNSVPPHLAAAIVHANVRAYLAA